MVETLNVYIYFHYFSILLSFSQISDRFLYFCLIQDFRVGYQSKSGQEPESTQASNLSNHTDANKVWVRLKLEFLSGKGHKTETC